MRVVIQSFIDSFDSKALSGVSSEEELLRGNANETQILRIEVRADDTHPFDASNYQTRTLHVSQPASSHMRHYPIRKQ